jgi:hypothetical protein
MPSPNGRSNIMAKKNGASRPAARDAIAILKQDHERVRDLLDKLNGSSRANSRTQSLVARIEQEIKTHSRIEEEIFYPAFKEAVRSKGDQELYYEAKEEHHIVDVLMGEFQGGDSESFGAKCKVLKELVEMHLREEERQMFPKARKAIGVQELRELGERIADRKPEIEMEVSRAMKL